MINAYIGNIYEYDNEELFSEAYDTLPEFRKLRISGIFSREGTLQSLRAGLLLKRGLLDAGIDDTRVWTLATRFGRPIGRAGDDFDIPEGAKSGFSPGDEVYFSLSHSGEYALCAISGSAVGCDIEKISDRDRRTARRVLSEKEYEYYRSLESADGSPNEYLRAAQQQFFFKVWTIKESVMKAEGKGFALGLPGIVIDHEAGTAVCESSGNVYAFFTYPEKIPGYALSMCSLLRDGSEGKVRFVSDGDGPAQVE